MGADRERLAGLIERERGAYVQGFPRSRAAFEAAGGHLLGGVPMTWMRMWPGGFPVYQATASGARVTDVDGHTFTDFCLGDTGAMAGHSPAAVRAAVARRYAELGGATTMLPTEDAAWVAGELSRRFGAGAVELHADRHRRQPVGHPAGQAAHRAAEDPGLQLLLPRERRRVVHRRDPGRAAVAGRERRCAGGSCRRRRGWPSSTTSAALERELASGDVAAVLMEPALTNIGIVLPEPGYLAAVRELTRRARHAADQRRDPHVQRRTGRLHAPPGACPPTW